PASRVAQDREQRRAMLDAAVARETCLPLRGIGNPPRLPLRVGSVEIMDHRYGSVLAAEEPLPQPGVSVTLLVGLPHHPEYIVVKPEHQVQAVLLDALVSRRAAPARPFAS